MKLLIDGSFPDVDNEVRLVPGHLESSNVNGYRRAGQLDRRAATVGEINIELTRQPQKLGRRGIIAPHAKLICSFSEKNFRDGSLPQG